MNCTCPDTKCSFHPANHDKGCDPCIDANNRNKEIPNCFLISSGVDAKDVTSVEDSSFEGFAKMMLQK